MKLRILAAAEQDLNSSSDFYEGREAGLGAYFVDCLLSDIESLKVFAGVHAKRFGFHRMLSKRFPYSIYYDVIENEIVIFAIYGDRQSPELIESALRRRSQ